MEYLSNTNLYAIWHYMIPMQWVLLKTAKPYALLKVKQPLRVKAPNDLISSPNPSVQDVKNNQHSSTL